jgi:hypothetical protein
MVRRFVTLLRSPDPMVPELAHEAIAYIEDRSMRMEKGAMSQQGDEEGFNSDEIYDG